MARRSNDSLVFDTIQLEGGLLVPAVLEKVARGEHSDQSAADYQLPKGLSLADEQGRAFRIASALWKTFQPTRDRRDIDPHRATLAFATELLRDALGYSDFALAPASVEIANRGYPVTGFLRGRVAVIVAPHDLELDAPDDRFAVIGSGRRRLSAYQLAQQFLNASEPCTWALLTNGHQLRLVRDADTLTRPAFLEFDLDLILRDQRYADFRALWLVLHASRAGKLDTPGTDCVWEAWKKEGESQGERVRDGLRIGVTSALLTLGTGFLAHRQNSALRQRLENGSLTTDDYFQQLLRLIYRFLFLFCAEERSDPNSRIPLIHEASSDSVARDLYARGYALQRFRSLSLRRRAYDHHSDLWLSVRVVLRALESGQPKLALPALGGLFANSQCPDLDSVGLTNLDLLSAMRELRWFSDPRSGQRSAIDYRNMGPEELGSVYESLLELIPTLDLPARSFGFVGITDEGSTVGNTRKTTGSYYTPDSLVQELIKSALDPVIAQKIANHPENPSAALLTLSVIDPACGSGHFLISAARRIAEKLAELRTVDGAVTPTDYRHALREVIGHCIYGVDRNPMALELARTALWLEGFEPGKPLSFLDHHLQCGDALLGLTSFDQLRKGIAKDAFTVLSGDNKEVCKSLAATNRAAIKSFARRLKDKSAEFFDACDLDDALRRLEAIEAMPDGTTTEVDAKKIAFTRFLSEAQDNQLAHACDLLVAAYLTPKTQENESTCPTTATLIDVLFPQQVSAVPQAVIDHATSRCREARVFHWPLRFTHIFGHGGFDCVLGNPPWERIKLQEQEFFAAREPAIAAAKNKAERAKRIQWLSEGCLHYHLSEFESVPKLNHSEVSLFLEFENEKRIAEATSAFAHVNGDDGGRFPLTGVGDVNTYALFAETITQLTNQMGRAGFIVPTGIATDDSTKAFFSTLVTNERLVSLLAFENEELVFPGVHHFTKFCLVTIGGAGSTPSADLAFFARQVSWLRQPGRRFRLSATDFQIINPNTRTCPVFRSEADAELTKSIYRRIPVLIEEARDSGSEVNPWAISFGTMFHMSGDSDLFSDAPTPHSLPLYEAKLIHQFDHRWAHFRNRLKNKSGTLVTEDSLIEQKSNPDYSVTPRYWVPESEVLSKIARAPKCVRDAFKDRNTEALLSAIATWIEARHEPDLLDGMVRATSARQRVIDLVGPKFDDLPANEKDWLSDKSLAEAREWLPLTNEELIAIRNISDITTGTWHLLDQRSSRWFIGWRDITNSTNERTVISSVIPRSAIGHTMPTFSSSTSPSLHAALLANWNCLVLDFIARQKIGSTHLTYGYVKQLPILPPAAYGKEALNFIVPRVLELTYNADDLSDWARDLGHNGPPFRFDPDRRAQLRAELDAYYARLYGLTREELQYILDPASTHGPDYPTVTFPGLKKNEIAQFGEYRTQRLVLAAWDVQEEKLKDRYRCQQIGDTDWMDRPVVFPDLPRGAISASMYRAAVVPHLVQQAGGRLRFERFRRAFWLLSEPEIMLRFAKGEVGEEVSKRNRSHHECLSKDMLIPHLRGSIRDDMNFVSIEGERWLELVRSDHLSSDEHIIFDARIALIVADLWPEAAPISPLTPEEEATIRELEYTK
ncbi:Eco57I restriction-modification methylase domain-containing protein [Actomonas aquatica]|uniref:site-specific DNA-methyltransferase (adenine-specific) n=1 Tax=Actomonas aquatica TaxID=2866162 RepID=A0ABZ1C8N4_9BACT|nr:N-6 DNA methylase [Opitutus sp. WL0086]WRQ88062.1 N-6 DNA methylase [Opitutus sp. WL0086]